MKKKKTKGIEDSISLIIMKGFMTLLQKTGKYTCKIIRDGRDKSGIVEMFVRNRRYVDPCCIMIYNGDVIIMARRLELANPNVEEEILKLIDGFFAKS